VKVFTNNNFKGHWPVGTSAVVVAPDAEHAAIDLQRKLETLGLSQEVSPQEMVEIDTEIPNVFILADGNY
jgi:hypothetical protein